MMNQPIPSSAEFSLSYYGEAVSDHSMSVKDLGPALVALGDLFDRTNTLLYGNVASTDLKITATKQSSFDIQFLVEVLAKGKSIFADPTVSAAFNIWQSFSLAFAILKRLGKNRTVLSNQSNEQIARELETLDIVTDDFELSARASAKTIESAIELVRDSQFRRHSQDVVEPVRRNGIEGVEIKRGHRRVIIIEKADLPAFECDGDEDEVRISIVPRRALTIVFPYLGDGSGHWRLSDSAGTNWYAIRDEQFLERVRNGLSSFTTGDSLECQIRIIQHTDTSGKTKETREITRVYRHVRRGDEANQPKLDGF